MERTYEVEKVTPPPAKSRWTLECSSSSSDELDSHPPSSELDSSARCDSALPAVSCAESESACLKQISPEYHNLNMDLTSAGGGKGDGAGAGEADGGLVERDTAAT